MIKVREAAIEDLPLIVALIKQNNEPLNEDLAVFFTVKIRMRSISFLWQRKTAKQLAFQGYTFIGGTKAQRHKPTCGV